MIEYNILKTVIMLLGKNIYSHKRKNVYYGHGMAIENNVFIDLKMLFIKILISGKSSKFLRNERVCHTDNFR